MCWAWTDRLVGTFEAPLSGLKNPNSKLKRTEDNKNTTYYNASYDLLLGSLSDFPRYMHLLLRDRQTIQKESNTALLFVFEPRRATEKEREETRVTRELTTALNISRRSKTASTLNSSIIASPGQLLRHLLPFFSLSFRHWHSSPNQHQLRSVRGDRSSRAWSQRIHLGNLERFVPKDPRWRSTAFVG